MTSVAFHLFSYTLLFFVVGMFKPKWALFFLKEPTRFIVSSITLVMFMITMTVYGEGHKEEILQAKKVAETAAPAVSELPAVK